MESPRNDQDNPAVQSQKLRSCKALAGRFKEETNSSKFRNGKGDPSYLIQMNFQEKMFHFEGLSKLRPQYSKKTVL